MKAQTALAIVIGFSLGLLLVGFYAHAQTGPCSWDGDCPAGEGCVDGFCQTTGGGPAYTLAVSVSKSSIDRTETGLSITGTTVDSQTRTIKIYIRTATGAYSAEKISCRSPASPCKFEFDGTTFSSGSYKFQAKAFNSFDQLIETSSEGSFTVSAGGIFDLGINPSRSPRITDTVELSSKLTQPPEGSAEFHKIYIDTDSNAKVSCTNLANICKVTFRATDASYNYNAGEEHSFYAKVLDINGNVLHESGKISFTITAATLPTGRLVVQKAGAGSGTVMSDITGINCGLTCTNAQFDFASTQTIKLTAIAATGSTFDKWTGDCTGATCTLTMSAGRTVTANFNGTGGALTANATSLRIAVGGSQIGAAIISDGTPPYLRKTLCNDPVAYCDLLNAPKGDSLYVEGRGNGQTFIEVKDSSTPFKAINITINVGTGGTLCTPLANTCFVSGFGSYSGANPSDFTSDRARAWRIASCLPSTPSSMRQFKAYYDQAFSANTVLFRPDSLEGDKIKFPNDGWKDILINSNCWGYDPTGDLCARDADCLTAKGSRCSAADPVSGVVAYCSCASTSDCNSGTACTGGRCVKTGGDCTPGPYFDKLNGWTTDDMQRFCTQQTVKYKAGRVFMNYNPSSGVTQNLIDALKSAGLNPTRIDNQIIDFSDLHEGSRVGQIDVIKDCCGANSKWDWTVQSGGGSGTGNIRINDVTPTRVSRGTRITITGTGLKDSRGRGVVQFFDSRGESSRDTQIGNVNNDGTRITVAVPSSLQSGQIRIRVNVDGTNSNEKTILMLENNPPTSRITAPPADSVQSGNFPVTVSDVDESGLDKCYYTTSTTTTSSTPATPAPTPAILPGVPRPPAGTCEWPYASGVNANNPPSIEGECRGVLWGGIRNINTALGCSQSFTFHGVPASDWSAWRRYAQAVVDVCNTFPDSYVISSAQLAALQNALGPLRSTCPADSKGIACVCNPDPNNPLCGQFVRLIGGIAPTSTPTTSTNPTNPSVPASAKLRTCNSQFTLEVGQGKDCAQQGPCVVNAFAVDTNGNVGAPDSRAFQIKMLFTNITSPADGSFHDKNFSVDVQDRDYTANAQQPTNAPVITTFSADTTTATAGQTVTLTWATTGATAVTIDGTGVPVSGTKQVNPSQTTTYTLAATNSAGTSTRTVSVTVGATPPSTVAITCTYDVYSLTQKTVDGASRRCNDNFTVSIGVDSNCKDPGERTCRVVAKINKTVNGVRVEDTSERFYTIDWISPESKIVDAPAGWVNNDFMIKVNDDAKGSVITECQYRVVSGGTETVRWTSRSCSSGGPATITITAGNSSSKNCRHEGGEACIVYVRPLGRGRNPGINDSKPIAVIFGDVDTNGFNLPLGALKTIRGINFSGTTRTSLRTPTFYVCNSRSSVAGCISTFASGQSGTDSDNYCGSPLTSKCQLRCSDRTVSFYFVARGLGTSATTLISPIRSASCPTFNIARINSFLDQFQKMEKDISIEMMFIDQFIVDNGENEEFNNETLDILGDALLLTKDHLNYMNLTLADLTETKAAEIITKSDQALDAITRILRGIIPATHTKLSVNMPATVRFNRTTVLQATITRTGNRNSYGRVYCDIISPAQTIITQRTNCDEFIGNNRFDISFLPNLIGTWGYSCKLGRSARSDCSFEVNMTPVAGRFNALPGLGTYIDGMTTPVSVMRGQSAAISATVKNPDEVEKFATLRCDFTDPLLSVRRNSSPCVTIPAAGVSFAEVKMIADRLGNWTVSRCQISASEFAGCANAVLDNISRESRNYTVSIPEDVFIESAIAPHGDVMNDTPQSIIVLANNPKSTPTYATISCRLDRQNFGTPLIAVLRQGIEAGTSRTFDIRFDVNITGLWTVQNCTAMRSSSPDFTNSVQTHSVINLGSFNVIASSNLTIASVSFAPEIANGTSAGISVSVRNPSVTRFGRVSCAFRDPLNNARTNASSCFQSNSGTSTAATVSMFLDRRGTWNIDSCSVFGSVNSDCSQSALHSIKSPVGSFNSTAATGSNANATGANATGNFTDNSTSIKIISISVNDTVNNSNANIEILAGNPLGDDRFAYASCFVRDPNGISRLVTAPCEGIQARSTNTYTGTIFTDIVGRWNVTTCMLNASTSCSAAVLNDTFNASRIFTVSRGINVSFVSFVLPADMLPGLAVTSVAVRNPSDATRFVRVLCSFRTPGNQLVSNSTACLQVGGTAVQNFDVTIATDTPGTWRVDTCSIRASLSSDCADLHDSRANVGTFNITTTTPAPRLAELFVQNISAPAAAVNNSQINVIVFARNPNAANSSYADIGCSFVDPTGASIRQTSACSQITANSTQQFTLPRVLDRAGAWSVRDCFINASSSNSCSPSLLHNVSAETRSIAVTLPPDLYITSVAAPNADAVNNTNVPIDIFVSNPLGDDRYGSVSCQIEDPNAAALTRAAGCAPVPRQTSKRFNVSVFANIVGTWNVRNCSVAASTNSACSSAAVTSSLINGDIFRVIRGYNLTISNIAITSPAFVSSKIDVSYTLRNPSASERFGRVTCMFSRGGVNRSACFTIPAESFVDSKATIVTDTLGAWTVTCNAERSLDSSCATTETHDTEARTFDVVNPPDLFIQSFDMPELAPKDNLSVAILKIRNPTLTSFFGFAGCTFKNRLNETFRNVSVCEELSADTNNVAVGVIPELRGNWSVFNCFVNASRNAGCAGNRTHNVSTISKSFSVTAPLLTIDDVYLTSENLFVGDIADIAVNVRNIGEKAYTAFVNCTLFNPNNVQFKLTTLNQTIPLGETRAFHPQFTVDVAGRWKVGTCSAYRLGSIILEDTKTSNQQFNVQPTSSSSAECSSATPCLSGYACESGQCVQQTVCSFSNCPGTKAGCYCSSNQCIACGDGYTCSSGRCAPEIPVHVCSSNSECPADNICLNSVCQPRPPECFASSDCPSGKCSSGRCVADSKPLFDKDIVVLLIIILAVIMVPLILFIYIKRSL